MFILDKYRQFKANRIFRDKVVQWVSVYPESQYDRKKIIADYMNLYETKGLNMDEYYEFEFENQEEEFRRTFLGINEQRYYLDYLNPIKYYSFARNKFLTHKLLESTEVRKPLLYCYYQPEGKFESSEDIASDVLGVCRILKKKAVTECVIKPTEGTHGNSVYVIKNICYLEADAELTCFDGQHLRLSDILNNALIFESVISQTKQFSAFNASSVNTIRFVTVLFPNQEVKIVGTWLRIGRAGKCVDNAGVGGNIDASVEISNGMIYNTTQFDGWRTSSKRIERHPDNNNQIDGVFIENWDKILSEVVKFQQSFPYCKAAGWDIAITDEGPVVIEVNDFWDRTGQYFSRKGWRNEIRDCYKAWKNENHNYGEMGRLRNRLTLEHLKLIENHN